MDVRVKMTTKLDTEHSFSSAMVPFLHFLKRVLQAGYYAAWCI